MLTKTRRRLVWHAEHLVPLFPGRNPRRCRGVCARRIGALARTGGGDQRSNIHIASRDHAIKGRFHTLILLQPYQAVEVGTGSP